MRYVWATALALWLAGLGLFAYGAAAGTIVWGAGTAAFLVIALAIWLRARRDAAAAGREKPSLIEAIVESL